MIEMTLTVTMADETHIAKTNGWTVIQWERKSKQKYATVAQNGLGFEDLYLLAWIALKDNQIIVPDFEKFCQQVQNIEVDIEETNPTNGGA